MIVTTKVYNKYQTVVPLEIRKALGIEQNDILKWKLKKNGKIEVTFSKNHSEKEMIGKFKAKESFDSVKILKNMDRGEK